MLISLALIPFAISGIMILLYIAIIIFVLIFGVYEKILKRFRKKIDWK